MTLRKRGEAHTFSVRGDPWNALHSMRSCWPDPSAAGPNRRRIGAVTWIIRAPSSTKRLDSGHFARDVDVARDDDRSDVDPLLLHLEPLVEDHEIVVLADGEGLRRALGLQVLAVRGVEADRELGARGDLEREMGRAPGVGPRDLLAEIEDRQAAA